MGSNISGPSTQDHLPVHILMGHQFTDCNAIFEPNADTAASVAPAANIAVVRSLFPAFGLGPASPDGAPAGVAAVPQPLQEEGEEGAQGRLPGPESERGVQRQLETGSGKSGLDRPGRRADLEETFLEGKL